MHDDLSGDARDHLSAAKHDAMTRRQLLAAGGAVTGAFAVGSLLSACGDSSASPRTKADITLRAEPASVQLGARKAATWTFDGELPGRTLRLKQGRPVSIRVVNALDEPTSVHWHGLRIDNAADGVPGMTQKAVEPGKDFLYRFTPPDAGTFMFHSHVGMQLDRGLYGAIVVEPRRETLAYDEDVVLLFDDWIDGLAGTPDRRLAQLRSAGMRMGGMASATGAGPHTALDGARPDAGTLAGMTNDLQAGRLDPGDVPDYPLYLVNGRPPDAPATVDVRRGDRIRLRLVNPSADTMYLVFVEGHELQVVAADGMAVRPVRTDAVVLGMGERYDVLIDAGGVGARRIVGLPLGKRGRAVALLRRRGTTTRAPAPDAPLRMPRRVLDYADLRAADDAGPPAPDAKPRAIRLDLAMGRGPYAWTIGGQPFSSAEPIQIRRGESVRFVMRNKTMMPHPMHLHGHSFRVGPGGAFKDTALAVPGRELTLDWVADNPGTWAFHCHNVYHQEAGMMRRVIVA